MFNNILLQIDVQKRGQQKLLSRGADKRCFDLSILKIGYVTFTSEPLKFVKIVSQLRFIRSIKDNVILTG